MRAVRVLTGGPVYSADRPWLPGLPHVLAALATYFVFGGIACVTGLLLATLVSFVVFLPVTALVLNGGQAIDPTASAPTLPHQARFVLFLLWTVTAWLAAGLSALSVVAS